MGAIKLLSETLLEETYEYIHSKDFTYGTSVLVNLDSKSDDSGTNQNFSLTQFARFYFQETKEYGANGFFVEGFAKYANRRIFDYSYDLDAYEHKTYNAVAKDLT